MPISLTARLDADETFRKSIFKLCVDYVQNSRFQLDFYTSDYDIAHDILQCYNMMTRQDYVKLAKGHPRRYVLPVTTTQMHTMTAYLCAALFGDKCPHKVDPGTPNDDGSARAMNELLCWNAEQQMAGTYQLGWFWVENALTYNRGIFYDCYDSIYKWQWKEVPMTDEDGEEIIDEDTQEPKTELKKVRERVGGYCRMEIVSPYDFYIDQNMPMYRLQEGRFCGHRINIVWNNLKRRSDLPTEDVQYVSPRAVKELKIKPAKSLGYPTPGTITGGTAMELVSRTAYERTRINTPLDSRYDAKDPGVVSVVELWARIIPKDYDIDERTEPVMYQIVMGNEREVLAMNESVYEHDMFPYSVAEPRPSPFYQYTPSYVMLLKNIQDYIDYLKNRHMDAVTRTLGNVFLAKSHLIDVQDFEDPDKEGKFISILPEAGSQPISEVIKQVPMIDMTANFISEMKEFINFSESTSGATQSLQGGLNNSDSTATAFQGSLQMAQGRLSAIGRLLSVQGIVPQTKRMVSNMQQFYDGELIRRIEGPDLLEIDGNQMKAITITPDSIQGTFDFRAHDGTLPGADPKRVAALSRTTEAMMAYPALFQPGTTNINPKRVFLDLFRISGMKPEDYVWQPSEIAEAQQQAAAAQQAAAQQAAAANQKPPEHIKPSMSVQIKWDQLTPEERVQMMGQIGIQEPHLMVPGAPGPIPLVPPGNPPPPPPPHLAPLSTGGHQRPGPPNQGGPRSRPMIPAIPSAAPTQPRPV